MTRRPPSEWFHRIFDSFIFFVDVTQRFFLKLFNSRGEPPLEGRLKDGGKKAFNCSPMVSAAIPTSYNDFTTRLYYIYVGNNKRIIRRLDYDCR